MNPTKRYLLIYAGLYIAFCVLGYALFKSPALSAEYLSKHGEEHERFEAITLGPNYRAWHQRPDLFVEQDGVLTYNTFAISEADVEFVHHYEDNPAFQAEEHRIHYFHLYFKSLSSIFFLWIIVHFARKPLVSFLDNKIHETRTRVDAAARAREEAARKQAEAEQALAGWAETEQCMVADTDRIVAAQVAKIQEEARLARIRLERDVEDHKRAEAARAAAILREELVNQAIETLKQRYKDQAPLDELKSNVDQFVRLAELLS